MGGGVVGGVGGGHARLRPERGSGLSKGAFFVQGSVFCIGVSVGGSGVVGM